jgi:outer membrane protein assembly factor BamB
MGKGKEMLGGDPMSHARYRILGRVIRWAVIVVGAIIIGGVIVDSYRLHLYSSRFVATKQAARVTGAPIPEKWQFTKAGPISAALALDDDGVVFAASQDGFLYAVDAAGNLQWKFSAGADASGARAWRGRHDLRHE